MTIHSSVLAWGSHGQRSLVGYGPWVCRVNMTEHAHMLTVSATSPWAVCGRVILHSQGAIPAGDNHNFCTMLLKFSALELSVKRLCVSRIYIDLFAKFIHKRHLIQWNAHSKAWMWTGLEFACWGVHPNVIGGMSQCGTKPWVESGRRQAMLFGRTGKSMRILKSK